MSEDDLKAAMVIIRDAFKAKLPDAMKDLAEAIILVPQSNRLAQLAFVADLAMAAHNALLAEGIMQ
jgi:hypothetical protein